jgi:hypothetical protein
LLLIQEQAFDRAHRFGQTRDVNIFKLTIEKTVEDRILIVRLFIQYRLVSNLMAIIIAPGEKARVDQGCAERRQDEEKQAWYQRTYGTFPTRWKGRRRGVRLIDDWDPYDTATQHNISLYSLLHATVIDWTWVNIFFEITYMPL